MNWIKHDLTEFNSISQLVVSTILMTPVAYIIATLALPDEFTLAVPGSDPAKPFDTKWVWDRSWDGLCLQDNLFSLIPLFEKLCRVVKNWYMFVTVGVPVGCGAGGHRLYTS